jgi:hypothetical protein
LPGQSGAGSSISANVAIGYQSLYSVTSAAYNAAFGYRNQMGLTTGSGNFSSGYQTLYYNQTGNYNTVIGYNAGRGVSGNSFSGNILIGKESGYSLSTGSYNIILGENAGFSNVTGSYDIFIGYNAGYYETAGSKFYITNQKGSDEATGRAMALLYGVMDPTTANQELYINAKAFLNYDVTIADGKNLILNTTNGTKIGTAANQKLGFFNATPVVQQSGLTQLTYTSPGTPDYNLQDVTQTTPWGFADAEELRTFIKVVADLQTSLKNLGLVN